MLQKRKYLCSRIDPKPRRHLSKNQSGFAFGILSFKYWLLRHDPNFLAKNNFFTPIDRNHRHQNRSHHFYYFGTALHKHFNINQIHSQIN